MRFLIKKTPDKFLKTVNDEISSILSRNMDGLFPDYGFPEEEKLAMDGKAFQKVRTYLFTSAWISHEVGSELFPLG